MGVLSTIVQTYYWYADYRFGSCFFCAESGLHLWRIHLSPGKINEIADLIYAVICDPEPMCRRRDGVPHHLFPQGVFSPLVSWRQGGIQSSSVNTKSSTID